MRTHLLLAAVALVGSASLAQAPGAHWSTTPAGTNPPVRTENPGTASSSDMYLFGGAAGSTRLNDLWRFNGAAWTLMTADGAAGSPPARSQAGVTWDFGRNRLVVFGGSDAAGTELGDTWEWDPSTNVWTDVTPVGPSPSARTYTAITFDPRTGTILLFGGLDAAGTHLDDTWSFDGTSWTQLSPIGSLPPARRQHHLVTRLDFADVVLFGGQDATLSSPANWRVDTWTWDGRSWTQVPTSTRPNAQVANDAAYDLIRQRIVLTGGNGTGGQPVGTTAEFDSLTNEWINRPLDSGIYKTSRYFAAFVPALGKTFKVSGQALNASQPATQTYEFQSDVIASFAANGSGCATSSGVPELSTASRPWLGRSLDLQVANTPASASTLIALGLTTTSISLGAVGIGAANCVLTADPMVLLTAPRSTITGLASASLPIPLDNSLVGGVLHSQAVVLDAGVGAVSNRGDATLGAL
jgi:hypothetical protein